MRRGLDAADLEQSLATLHRMADEARAAAALVRLLPGRRGGRRCAIVRVHRLCVPDVTYTDLRVAGASWVGIQARWCHCGFADSRATF